MPVLPVTLSIQYILPNLVIQKPICIMQDELQPNRYILVPGFTEVSPFKDLKGKIFVCRRSAFKIVDLTIKQEINTAWVDGIVVESPYITGEFFIEECAEETANLLERVKKIKETMLVCADSLEELSGLKAAKDIRNHANLLTFYDLFLEA